MHFTISFPQSKIRLDKFLSQKFPQYSRSRMQKLIKEGLVSVNKKGAFSHYLLKQGDRVKVIFKEPEPIDLQPKKGELDIVFEDENFLVINKPAGLVVHPSQTYKKDTLINLLLDHYPEIKNVGEKSKPEPEVRISKLPPIDGFQLAPGFLRPGIVHRLDKDVSGLIVIAKTQKAFEHLKDQFKNRKVRKEYIVLVHGKVKESQGRIVFPIGRSKKKGFKMIIRFGKKAKEAETYFEVIKCFPVYTLLKIQTKSGRTHQIRVHLNAIGCPIVGEKIYKPRKLKTIDLGRLFLHASSLGFYNLEGKWQEFKMDLPGELRDLLKSI